MRRTSALLAVAAALIFAALGVTQASAARLLFDPSGQVRSVGDLASVDVLFDPEGGGLLVGAFDITVGFDSSIVTFNSITFGSQLGDPGLFEAVTSFTPGAGSINAAETSLLVDLSGLQDGNPFPLFSLDFTAVSIGVSPLNFSFALLSDDQGLAIDPLALTSGSITVSDIPEPSTSLLLLGGLAAAVALLRRRAWRP